MDVHNVTERYTNMIASQRMTLVQAKARQGQRPRDRKSREDAYAKFMMTLKIRESGQQEVVIYSSFVPPAYAPCTVPLTNLRRISIRELQLEMHHRGTYLLLRSITPPSRMTAVVAVMEDENGDVALLQLYQQEEEEECVAADIINVGTILLIKEPCFKVTGEGEYGLRIDHLSDAVHVGKYDDMTPEKWQAQASDQASTAESLKIKGNKAIGEGSFEHAILE